MLSGYTGEGRKKMPRTLGRGYALAFHEDADTRTGHKGSAPHTKAGSE